MANITRFDPFRELTSLDPFRNFDEWFAAPVPRLRSWMRDLPAQPEIRMDVTEDDKAYHVKAEIPGVKKDDINVAIDGNQVSITVEVRQEKEEKKGEKLLHSERYYGSQSRTFSLLHEVDQSKAEAKYVDGVLELTLPKKGAAPVKKLAVQ
jgi:HSP20 family protein